MRSRPRSIVGGVALLVVVLGLGLLGFLNSCASGTSPQGQGSPSASAASSIDPDSGLPWVAVADLPSQARDTLELIDAGGPYPYDRDGVVFSNFEGLLPKQKSGYYHEYTVSTPGSKDRGARRIITGSKGEFYWTADHYASFQRIRR